MAEPTGENKQVNSDDSKYQDENFLKKLKLLAEQVGMTVEEAIERKLSKNQLKKMVKTEVSLPSGSDAGSYHLKSRFKAVSTKNCLQTLPSSHSKRSSKKSAKGLARSRN